MFVNKVTSYPNYDKLWLVKSTAINCTPNPIQLSLFKFRAKTMFSTIVESLHTITITMGKGACIGGHV